MKKILTENNFPIISFKLHIVQFCRFTHRSAVRDVLPNNTKKIGNSEIALFCIFIVDVDNIGYITNMFTCM